MVDHKKIELYVSNCKCSIIVIRSTVSPETCDYLAQKYKKRIIMQPEYFGEISKFVIILGGKSEDRKELINLYQNVYKNDVKIKEMTALEAEILKFNENKIISPKNIYAWAESIGYDPNNGG